MASKLIGRTLNPFRNDPVHDDKYKYGDSQLEQNSSHWKFCGYFEPVFWIWGVTLPEPPEYHGEELEREENIDNDIEQFSCFYSLFWKRNNLLSKSSGAVFEDGNSEKETAEHKTDTPDPILIVEKSHANSRRKAEEKSQDRNKGDRFFSSHPSVHKYSRDQLYHRD